METNCRNSPRCGIDSDERHPDGRDKSFAQVPVYLLSTKSSGHPLTEWGTFLPTAVAFRTGADRLILLTSMCLHNFLIEFIDLILRPVTSICQNFAKILVRVSSKLDLYP